MFVEGELLDTVCAIQDSRTEIVMLAPPGGGTCFELSTFVRPAMTPGSPDAMATALGLRNVAFEVDDVHAGVIESLFASDLAFLQDLYRRVNQEGHTRASVHCPACRHEFQVDVVGSRLGEP